MEVLKSFLPSEIDKTAIGIDAVTVNHALSERYSVDAPNMTPKSDPRNIAFRVNSFTLSVAEM